MGITGEERRALLALPWEEEREGRAFQANGIDVKELEVPANFLCHVC